MRECCAPMGTQKNREKCCCLVSAAKRRACCSSSSLPLMNCYPFYTTGMSNLAFLINDEVIGYRAGSVSISTSAQRHLCFPKHALHTSSVFVPRLSMHII